MSEVALNTTEVVREWNRRGQRDVEFSLVSNSPVQELVALIGPVIDAVNQQFSGVAFIYQPAPYPRGVVFFADYCDDVAALRDILEQIADAARKAGVEGKIGPINSQYGPLSSHLPWGFVAGFSVRGEPAEVIESNPGKKWDADTGSMSAIVDHALEWCQVDGGEHWLAASLSTFKVEADQRRELIAPAIASDQVADLVSGRGTKLSRVDAELRSKLYEVDLAKKVVFTPDGHVTYGITSDGPLDWQECVDDLTTVIRDLHTYVDYAMVQRCRVTPTVWRELHRGVWIPWVRAHARDVGLQRADERTHVVNAYGIQLLGPGHRPIPDHPRWEVESIGSGRTIVSDHRLADWFGGAPTFNLYAEARENFGELVGNSWNPRQADPAR